MARSKKDEIQDCEGYRGVLAICVKVTEQEKARVAERKKTHCTKGHLKENNTYASGQCKTCTKESMRRKKAGGSKPLGIY